MKSETKRPDAKARQLERDLARAVKTINNLYRLVYEHHGSRIMRDEYCICPICSQRSWQRILDAAEKLKHAAAMPNVES